MRAAFYVAVVLAGCGLIVAGVSRMSEPVAMVVAGFELLLIAYTVRYFDVRSSTNADS